MDGRSLVDHPKRLERNFPMEEVKVAVYSLEEDKASGSNGFSLAFYRDCFDILKIDLVKVLMIST